MKKSKRISQRNNRRPLRSTNLSELHPDLLWVTQTAPESDKSELLADLIQRARRCMMVRPQVKGAIKENDLFDLEDDIAKWLKKGYRRDAAIAGFRFSRIGPLLLNRWIDEAVPWLVEWFLNHPDAINQCDT